MRLLLLLALAGPVAAAPTVVGSKEPLKPLVSGLKNPESVCLGPGGVPYVTCIGDFGKKGDGTVVRIKDGKAEVFADGLDDPKGIVFTRGEFLLTDIDRIVRLDRSGRKKTWKKPEDFPVKPMFLNDIAVHERMGQRFVFVSDSGNLKGGEGKVFEFGPTGKGRVLVDGAKSPLVKTCNGLSVMSEFHLLLLDFHSGELLRVALKDGKTEKLAEGFGGGDGIAFDKWGRLFLTDWKNGKVFALSRADAKPKLLAEGLEQAADPCLSADGKSVLVPDMKGGAVYSIPCQVPGEPLDESDLKVSIVPAFADMAWTGWEPRTPRGLPNPLRPIVLTPGGDGWLYMATQQGVIHRFKKGDKKSEVFLDIRDRVRYDDKENEEGFLGLAFAPDFKTSGVFYAYYTPRRKGATAPFPKGGKTSAGEDMTNVLVRYKAKDGLGDKASEEKLMTFVKPYWNHDGGTLCFGPDGFLYVAVGDGGFADDPYENAQNLKSLLGKIHRIDVSKKGEGKPYAIPADNPFADGKAGLPEIWAYGLRNVWRMSFDKKTGKLWAADVGQNLWEEVNLIEKGGNYGWNPRESFHPFGRYMKFGEGSERRKEYIDPIWGYHHDLVGKSITGGHVYRGKAVPALAGKYLYADYVAGSVWALQYDESAKRVTGNHRIAARGHEAFSFGEDDEGEAYFLKLAPDGKGIFTFKGK
ncbi:MAG: PQQ-dependent sugar dehydrogenase [Gemmataceae bacterium]|nr:PQQ-dependent sugar dehydrogenase [Gemmataceae bacterium]